MTVTVTPTVELSTGYGDPPRVQLDVADTGSLTEVTVTRLNPDGRTVPVRTEDGGPLPLSSGVGLVYDYEPWFGQPATYSTLENPSTMSSPVTVGETQAWLINPGVPEISMPIDFYVGSFAEEEWGVRQGIFWPMGRETPVVQSDGVLRAPASSVTVVIDTPDELTRLKTLLRDAGTLLLNVPPSLGLGVDTAYISVGAPRNRRISDIGSDPHRAVDLPYLVVDRPAGGTQAERTLVDLLAYPSLASLAAAYDTLFDVLAGP